MKAVVIREFGGIERLEYGDIETPIPGPGEVLVRLRAAGVNHLDHDVREGVSGFPVTLPHVPGIEGSGEVAELGPGVSSTEIGARVSINLLKSCGQCRNCLGGLDNICLNGEVLGVGMWGTFAEYVRVHERQLTAMPDALSFEAAAATHLCFSTAWHMTVTLGGVRADMDVLVNAAGSGVGSAALQIAVLHGANVIASAGSDEKLVKAKALGAADVINYSTQKLAEEAVRLTGGKGPDLVVECVGGEVLRDSITAVRSGGMLVTCGAHAGEQIQLDVIELFRKHLRLQGSSLATRLEMEHVLSLVGDGKLKPVIHTSLPLEKVQQAATLIANRNFFGKMVLTV